MNFKALGLAGALGMTALAPLAASAGSVNGSFVVDATVPPNCTAGVGGFHFGVYDPLVANASADIQTYAGFALTCTAGTNPTLGTPVLAPLTDGTDTLTYTITYSNGLTGPWGIHNTKAINFLGDVPAGQDVEVGSYTGSATVPVNF